MNYKKYARTGFIIAFVSGLLGCGQSLLKTDLTGESSLKIAGQNINASQLFSYTLDLVENPHVQTVNIERLLNEKLRLVTTDPVVGNIYTFASEPADKDYPFYFATNQNLGTWTIHFDDFSARFPPHERFRLDESEATLVSRGWIKKRLPRPHYVAYAYRKLTSQGTFLLEISGAVTKERVAYLKKFHLRKIVIIK